MDFYILYMYYIKRIIFMYKKFRHIIMSIVFYNEVSLPSGQNRKKKSLKESIFVNSALKIQCHIVNTGCLYFTEIVSVKYLCV